MTSKPSNDELEEVARRMTHLDDQAFQEFANYFGPRFWRAFLRSGLSASDAEEVAASCVTDIALKVADRYRPTPGGSFKAWVYTLAHHALIDWLRHNPRTEPLNEDLFVAARYAEESEPNSTLVAAVTHALEQLSHTDQQIIRLRNLEMEQPYEEIGHSLGIQPGAARVRHLRAIKRLQGLLEEDPRIQSYLKERASRSREETLS